MRKAVSKFKQEFPYPLLGSWRNDHFLAEWTIATTDKRVVVCGSDSETGNRFKISNVSWTRKHLKFTSQYPSTRRVVIHECRSLSKNEMLVTLTYEVKEVWIRQSPTGDYAQTKKPSLVGSWHNPKGDDFRIVCTISLSGRRPRIRMEDIGDGERSLVRNMGWEGKTLKFDTKVPSTGQLCHRKFTPLSSSRVYVGMKFRESFIWNKGRSEKGSKGRKRGQR